MFPKMDGEQDDAYRGEEGLVLSTLPPMRFPPI